MYQVTRHLSCHFDAGSSLLSMGRGAKYLLKNDLLGTRLLCSDEIWEILENYEEPRALGDSLLEKRAVNANILCTLEETVERTRLGENFRSIATDILKEKNIEPHQSLSQLALIIKDHCKPQREHENSVHYLWRDPQKLFHIMMDHMVIYAQNEIGTPAVGKASSDFTRQSLGRPERNSEYAQQLCTLSTSLSRARLIKKHFPAPAKFLTLGDDDLMSLALASEPGYEVDVFEIDRKLVRFLNKKKNPGIRVFSRDLTNGLPTEFQNQYDAVLADPPYDREGMNWFLRCCSTALKNNKKSRLYLSTYPDLLEDAQSFFTGIKENGLRLETTRESFNRYPFPKETHKITQEGLLGLGYHPKLISTLMQLPYLYAHLFECSRAPSA